MDESRSSLKSVSLLTACSLGQLIVLFALQIILAKVFGSSSEMDAYVAAIAFPTVVSSVFVGSLGYAFVPVFAERRRNAGEEAAWDMASSLGILLVLVVGTLSAVGCLAARPIMAALHPGFTEAKLGLTARLFGVLTWLALVNSLITYLQALYHSHQRYVPTAIGPLAGVLITLVWVILLHGRMGIMAVATGVLVGSGTSVCIQLPLFIRNFRWQCRLEEGALRCLRLLTPLVIGAAYYKLDPLVDRYLASQMTAGSISHLGYSWRIISALLLLSSSGLSVVVFPVLAEHSAASRWDRHAKETAHALRFLAFVLVPIVTGLLLFGRPAVRDLFERGRFGPQDTRAVANLLSLYVGVLIAGSVGEIFTKVLYSLKDTLTPVLIGVVGFTIGATAKFGLGPRYGVAGIVLATSIYFMLNASLEFAVVVKRIGISVAEGLLAALARALAATAGAALVAYGITQVGSHGSTAVAAAAAAAVYLGLAAAIGDEFAARFWKTAASLIRRRPGLREPKPENADDA